MTVRYFRWTQEHDLGVLDASASWYLEIALERQNDWDLRRGQYVEGWNPDTSAFYDDEVEPTDFPVTSDDIPVYSPRLMALMDQEGVEDIQFLPLRVKHRHGAQEVFDYHIANYLKVIDCLNRQKSNFQVWTEDNLLFWQKRPWMLGTFRDVQRPILDVTRIGRVPVFRLWGWEVMVVIRGDIKQAIEDAGITGCRFTEVELVS